MSTATRSISLFVSFPLSFANDIDEPSTSILANLSVVGPSYAGFFAAMIRITCASSLSSGGDHGSFAKTRGVVRLIYHTCSVTIGVLYLLKTSADN